jgi:TPR repeat protein
MKGLYIFPVLLIFLFGSPAFADYQKGLDALESGDYATAFKEWKPLAEQGNAQTKYNLGVMYSDGQGVTQDYQAAFKLAAEQGDADAQFNLGLMYASGRGVIQDYARAHMWWNIASSQGDKDAAKNMDIVAKEMTYTQIEKAQNAIRCLATPGKSILNSVFSHRGPTKFTVQLPLGVPERGKSNLAQAEEVHNFHP